MRLGVVMPLANEQGTVEELLAGVLSHLPVEDAVFCVLDRVSTDSTRERVSAQPSRDRRVRLIWAPENRCVVDAYFRGYRAAYDAGCRWVLEMDGGMSHQPDEIPRFLTAIAQG